MKPAPSAASSTSTSTKKTSAFCKTRKRPSKTPTKSPSSQPSPGVNHMAAKNNKLTTKPDTGAKKPAAKLPKTSPDARETKRLWLMYPAKLITRPIIWELGQKFPVVFNIRQVSVTEEIGIVCLELEGKRSLIKDAIKWLESQAISVEPVEINVIES